MLNLVGGTAGRKEGKVKRTRELHLIFFIRDTAPERLVLSLKFSPILTRGVSYLSLILRPILHSLSLIS